MLTIFLTARPGDELLNAWKANCGDLDFVEVYEGSILDLRVDAIVSPANSFGFMDGGIDGVYTNYFGASLQERLQEKIQFERQGEILVGEAETVETFNANIPYLISAPTMRVPMLLGDTSINPYLAAKAALHEALAYEFDSVAFPGLGTGVGAVPPFLCGHQVRAAIDEVILKKGRFPKSWHDAQTTHQLLCQHQPRDLQYPV